MSENGKNYLELKIFSIINTSYMYFDRAEYVADKIFIDEKLKVKFLKDAAKSGEDYVICMVKVRKKDRQKFVDCMDELRRKMLLLEGESYNAFCERMIEKMA